MKFLLFLVAMSNLIACQSDTANNPKVVDSAPDLDQKKISQLEAEVKVGRGMASQMINYFGVWEDEAVTKYVTELGNFVASRSNDSQRYYMFEILDSNSINAFSAPGGYIFITKGAIEFSENEAELATILGHEIAHVEGLHMFKTLESISEKKKQEKQEAHARLPTTIRARERVSLGAENSIASQLSRYLMQGGLGMSILTAVNSGVNLVLKSGIDHKYEYEADANGVEYVSRCGYDPKAITNFLGRLKEKKKSVESSTLEKTHPSFEVRIQKINTQLDSFATDSGALGKARFDSFKKRLISKNTGKTLKK